MQLKPEEISKVIRSQNQYYQNAIEQSEDGNRPLWSAIGIARVSGLTNCMSGELLEFGRRHLRNGPEPGRNKCFCCIIRI